jgi:hypothetical protein
VHLAFAVVVTLKGIQVLVHLTLVPEIIKLLYTNNNLSDTVYTDPSSLNLHLAFVYNIEYIKYLFLKHSVNVQLVHVTLFTMTL